MFLSCLWPNETLNWQFIGFAFTIVALWQQLQGCSSILLTSHFSLPVTCNTFVKVSSINHQLVFRLKMNLLKDKMCNWLAKILLFSQLFIHFIILTPSLHAYNEMNNLDLGKFYHIFFILFLSFTFFTHLMILFFKLFLSSCYWKWWLWWFYYWLMKLAASQHYSSSVNQD